jgi:hypothetical protein
MNLKCEKATTQDIKGVLQNAAAMETLDGAARYIRMLFPTLFVYRGGSHIAIHTHDKGPRYAIITE